jgi:hypothetical protein
LAELESKLGEYCVESDASIIKPEELGKKFNAGGAFLLYTVYCMMYILYILYTVYCILYTVYCILYTVYTVHLIPYTLYLIPYTLYLIPYTFIPNTHTHTHR